MTIATRLEQQGLKKGLQQGLQQGEQRGLQKGLQQGLQQGEQRGLQKSIINLFLVAKLPLETIATYLQVDIDFVKKTLKDRNLLK